jgi:threonine dehydrogenase-like Zn-dependent dehydrogenase
VTTMRAYRGFAGDPQPRLVELPVPSVGDGEILVRIASAGLTYGTFALQKAGRLKPMPMTLGHEGAGIVEAVGRGVTTASPGDRVRIHPTLSCGRCTHCLTDRDHMCWGSAMMGFVSFDATVPDYARYHDGFLADYALVPERQIDKLPDNATFDAGAKLHYMANAWRALRVADLRPGATLAILGATGSMGVATIKLAGFFGVSKLVLIGRSSARLAQVGALSSVPVAIVSTDLMDEDWADTGALPRRMAEVAGDGVDAIIDYLPEGGAMWQAASGLVADGTFVNMGGGPQAFGFSMRALVGKCWKVAGTRNHSRLDARQILRLMGEGALDIEDLITHRRPLAEVDAAVETLTSRTEAVWMSVVHP